MRPPVDQIAKYYDDYACSPSGCIVVLDERQYPRQQIGTPANIADCVDPVLRWKLRQAFNYPPPESEGKNFGMKIGCATLAMKGSCQRGLLSTFSTRAEITYRLLQRTKA